MQLTKNFRLSEFRCKDAAKTPVPADLIPNVQELANNLQILRDHLTEKLRRETGDPEEQVFIILNSGYRTPQHNAQEKGSPNSRHLTAQAADIHTSHYTPAEVRTEIELLIAEGKMKQGGLGSYTTFTHYDVRGWKARWKY